MKSNHFGHVPLRVPAGWDDQAKMLVVQIDRLFDELYNKIGNLQLELKEIKNAQGDETDGGTNDEPSSGET